MDHRALKPKEAVEPSKEAGDPKEAVKTPKEAGDPQGLYRPLRTVITGFSPTALRESGCWGPV